MSILIKSMEMPISCECCPMLDWDLDYIKCKVTDRHFKMTECWRSIRVPDCPLVSIPEHGRLIDADNIGLTNFEIILCQKGNPFKNALEMLLEKIENAPTIIPAEEGE